MVETPAPTTVGTTVTAGKEWMQDALAAIDELMLAPALARLERAVSTLPADADPAAVFAFLRELVRRFDPEGASCNIVETARLRGESAAHGRVPRVASVFARIAAAAVRRADALMDAGEFDPVESWIRKRDFTHTAISELAACRGQLIGYVDSLPAKHPGRGVAPFAHVGTEFLVLGNRTADRWRLGDVARRTAAAFAIYRQVEDAHSEQLERQRKVRAEQFASSSEGQAARVRALEEQIANLKTGKQTGTGD